MYKIKKNLLFTSIIIFLILGCSKTSTEEGFDNYKNRFLKLVELECNTTNSEHFVDAFIDGIHYCSSTNDSIKNQIYLINSFSTSAPNTDSVGIIHGSSFKTIEFGIYRNYLVNSRLKYFYLKSDKYPDTSTLYEIASDIFVKGKKWPISNNGFEKSVHCIFEFSDDRKGFNTFYLVSSEFGPQNNAYLSFDNVVITRQMNHYIFDVECSFEANLYTNNKTYPYSNMWGELRNGKMKARFIINI